MLNDFAAVIVSIFLSISGALSDGAEFATSAVNNVFFPATPPTVAIAEPQPSSQFPSNYDPFHATTTESIATSQNPNSDHATLSQNVNPPKNSQQPAGLASQDAPATSVAGSEKSATTLAASKSIPAQGQVLGATTQAQPTSSTLPLPSFITREEFLASLDALAKNLHLEIAQRAIPALTFSGPAVSTPVNTATFAVSQRIDQLANVALTNATVNGLAGLTDADLPDSLTASNYLPLSGGTLTGDLSLSGTLTAGALAVSGVSSGGAIAAPYFTATSSADTSSFQKLTATHATTTSLFVKDAFFHNASIGGTATSTFSSTGALSLAGGLTLFGNPNGPLHTNNGLVSATTSIGVLYGGTGLTSAPSYGQMLVGNSSGGYALTATSSLGLIGSGFKDWQIAFGALTPTTTLGILVSASSTIGNGTQAGGLTVSGGATTTGNAYFAASVGIGTVPSTALNVYGSTAVPVVLDTSNTQSNLQFKTGGTSRGYFGYTTAGTGGLAFQNATGLTATLLVTDAGLVGIGTAAPVVALHVNSSTGGALENKLTNSDTGVTTGDGFGIGIDTSERGFLWNYENTDVYLGTNNAERMRITSSGNVGINQTSPTYKLDVTGLGRFTGLVDAANFVATSTTATSTFAGGLAVETSGLVYDYSTNRIGIGTASPGHVLDILGGLNATVRVRSNVGDAYFTADANAAGNYAGIRFNHGSTNYWELYSDGTQNSQGFNIYSAQKSGGAAVVFSVLKDGQVGIGTTTPYAKLSVTNTGSGPTFVVEDDTTPDTTPFLIDASGNVGIGTASPIAKMDVRLSGENVLALVGNSSSLSGYRGIGFGYYEPGPLYQKSAIVQEQVGDAGALGKIHILNNIVSGSANASLSDARLTVGTNGYVGVASTTPWRTLSVTGTIGFDGLTSSTGAGSLCLDGNKQVVYNSASDNCLSSTRATKHAILDLSLDGLRIIDALQPVSFVYNEGDGRVRYGFIAEDTAAVDAHLATYNASGTVSGIDDRSILAVLVGALKDLYARVQEYFARTERLEERVNALEAQLSASTVQKNASVPPIEETPAKSSQGDDGTAQVATTTPPSDPSAPEETLSPSNDPEPAAADEVVSEHAEEPAVLEASNDDTPSGELPATDTE